MIYNFTYQTKNLINGIFIKEWNNLSEASIILNIQHRTLYKIINQNTLDDFIWKYKTNNN